MGENEIFLTINGMNLKDNIFIRPVRYGVQYTRGRRMINREMRRSEEYFKACWGSKDTPITLPLHSKSTLKCDAPTGYFNFNPTIVNNKLKLKLYSRISNISFSSLSDRRGKFKPRGKDLPLENQIVCYDYHNGEVDNKKEITALAKVPNYEDPRAIVWRNEIWLVTNKVTKLEGKTSKNWRTIVTLLNPSTKEEFELESPWNLPIEKNWSHVPSDENLTFLYISNPQVLVSYDLEGKLVQVIEQPSKFPLLNGGSSLIAVGKDRYLRLGRSTYWYEKRKIMRVNYLVLYNENFEEITCSMPFILKELGNEIANGLTMRDGMFYLTWSFDDEKSYIGTMTVEELLNFIEDNPHP